MDLFIFIFELLGTISFAFSGAVQGIRKKMDLFGIIMLGIITATGGGIMRDMILGQIPPAAFHRPENFAVAAVVSLLCFLPVVRAQLDASHKHFERLVLLADSAGLGIFTVCGARTVNYAGYGSYRILTLFCAVLTGVGGGVLRDLLSGERPYIFVKHFYACAAITGGLLCMFLWPLAGETVSLLAGCTLIMVMRLCAAKFRWTLPHA